MGEITTLPTPIPTLVHGSHGSTGNLAPMVDRVIGSSYDVVREVAYNLEYIKHVSAHLEQIYEVSGHLDAIDALYENIDKLEILLANLEDMIIVADNIDSVVIISDNITQLLTIYGELDKLIIIYNDINNIITVANNINEVIAVGANIDSVLVIEANLPELLEIQANLLAILSLIRDFATRADLVTWIAAHPAGTVAGRVYNAGGYQYQGSPGSTVIADLPGLLPMDDISPEHFGAKGDGIADDTAALKAVLAYGKDVEIPVGTYNTTALLFPSRHGQKISGQGPNQSIIQNITNDEPLWCFGDPMVSDGAKEFCLLEGLSLYGNLASLGTLWGIYVPSGFDTVDGCNADPTNVYASRGHAVWTSAARGNCVQDVLIRYVYGGYCLHVSAWGFRAERVQLWSSKRGIRNMGDGNLNVFDQMYISSMSEVSIYHPPGTGGMVKNTHYVDCIVQQSGGEGNACVALRAGEGTRITNMYLERNDEHGCDTDILIDASESNVVIDGITHKLEVNTGFNQTIIRCAAHNATIRNVDWRNEIKYALDLSSSVQGKGVIYSGIKPRNGNLNLQTEVVHIANASLNHLGFHEENYGIHIGPHYIGRVDLTSSATDKFMVKQSRSTAGTLSLESAGGIRFITDPGNLTSSGDFEWRTDGENELGLLLLKLIVSNGAFIPGAHQSQSLGGSANSWSNIYGTAFVFNGTGPRIVSGSGSPEGVVTANAGSLYLNSAGGPPYYKNTGTGTAGWVIMT